MMLSLALAARAVRTSLGALAQARSTFRRLSAEQATGIDWRKADGTKDHPVWSVPIETEPSKYDLVVLLALNRIRVYESIRGPSSSKFKLPVGPTPATGARASDRDTAHSLICSLSESSCSRILSLWPP
jgi:hypothetical protein